MRWDDSKIVAEFMRRTPASRKLAEAARDVFPSGVTHDARFIKPYPIYIDHAEAARKWDVDGNEYVDYVGGHGSLLLVTENAERESARRFFMRGRKCR